MSSLDRKRLNSPIEFEFCMCSGRVFHNVVVEGKKDDLNSSVLCRGTRRSFGRRRWYGFMEDVRGGR